MAGTTRSRLHQEADAGSVGGPNDRYLNSPPARVTFQLPLAPHGSRQSAHSFRPTRLADPFRPCCRDLAGPGDILQEPVPKPSGADLLPLSHRRAVRTSQTLVRLRGARAGQHSRVRQFALQIRSYFQQEQGLSVLF